MAQRPAVQTQAKTRLARRRVWREMTQEEMAQATGISLSTYRRLERGDIDNPPIGYLYNCARVLGCGVVDLMEQRGWFDLDARAPRPPRPSALWRRSDPFPDDLDDDPPPA